MNTLLLIDDDFDLRASFGLILRRNGYHVLEADSGAAGLEIAQLHQPDLILVDVNIPDMNGYEVCKRLKANAQLRDIPVIFISGLDQTEDKVKGFQAGGADYVAKPLQFEEVRARVELHLSLRRARVVERDLLERTLGGAVATLLDLVQITSPVLVLRTHSIRDIVLRLTKVTADNDAWQYNLAATLCLVGCIAIPHETFIKAYNGQDVSPDENHVFKSHPEIAARILSNIPRLEVVVEIIRRQQMADPDPLASEQSKQGAQMLHLAVELDRRICRGMDCHSAVLQLRLRGKFNGKLLDALEDYQPTVTEFDARLMRLRELRPGMILDEDISSVQTNALIIRQGVVLTPVWIERLENFKRSQGMQEQIRVRVPRLQGKIGSRA
jgi:DNA-binding response OmpR family regulator